MPELESTSGEEAQSLLHATQALLRDLSCVLSDRVQLLALEVRRAGQALAQVVLLVMAAAVLVCTAWIATWIGLAAAAIDAGASWGWVLFVVLGFNLGAAFVVWWRVRGLIRLLGLPATVRRLTVAPAASPVPAAAPIRKAPPANEFAAP